MNKYLAGAACAGLLAIAACGHDSNGEKLSGDEFCKRVADAVLEAGSLPSTPVESMNSLELAVPPAFSNIISIEPAINTPAGPNQNTISMSCRIIGETKPDSANDDKQPMSHVPYLSLGVGITISDPDMNGYRDEDTVYDTIKGSAAWSFGGNFEDEFGFYLGDLDQTLVDNIFDKVLGDSKPVIYTSDLHEQDFDGQTVWWDEFSVVLE